jgi:LigT like Phosphoesterase
MPRLFTGLEIPSDLALDLATLRGGLSGARWIDSENYHMTLRFIGNIDDAAARDVSGALEQIKRPPFTVTLDGLDSFGGDRPRAIIAKAKPAVPLVELQAEQERLMRRIGIPPARRLGGCGRRLSRGARLVFFAPFRGDTVCFILGARLDRRRSLCRRSRLPARLAVCTRPYPESSGIKARRSYVDAECTGVGYER